MFKARLILLLILGLTPWAWGAEANIPRESWRIDSAYPFEHDLETGRTTFTNTVTIYYSTNTVLTAERGMLDQSTGLVNAEGNVQLERDGHRWVGQSVRYNFNTGRATGEHFKTGVPPVFAQGDVLIADQQADFFVLANGATTTDDVASPGYRVVAKTLVVVPGDYIEARHATLRFGNTPVMYFPYYRRSLKQQGNRFSVTPGYRSVDGPFLLTSYDWYWNDMLEGTLHLDGRAKRGAGAGPDFKWTLPNNLGEGTLKSYYLNDADPGQDDNGRDINDDRYRVHLTHFASPRTNLTVKGALRYQSDDDVIREFFESEFRQNLQPSTFVEVDQLWHNYSLNAYAQPRVNDFYETVERLPDVQLNAFRQRLGVTPLFYESQSSAGYFQRRFAHDATNHFSAARADTYHQVVLPWTFLNWLNVTPRVGGRFTHYEEAHGSGGATDEQDRWVFHTGAEISAKASRVWPGIHNDFWEIDGLRHIIQPTLNYAYIPDPSPSPNRLPQFDGRVPTTLLLPLNFPEFSDIDAIDARNVIRYGLHNKLQTKRKDGLDNLAQWALFMDWNLDPEEEQRTYSSLYSDVDLKPFSWLTFTSQNQYDLNDGHLRLASHAVTFTPNNHWSLSLGQRYMNNEPALGPDSDYSLWFSSLYYRINDNWGLRLSQRYNSDNSTLEEQQYTLYRDLRSWTSALTLRIREDDNGPLDVTAAITFSLKAFPRYALGDDVNKPSLLLGN